MLQVVADHAHESHAERYRWVEPPVDHLVQGIRGHPHEVLGGLREDRVVVADEQLGAHFDRSDLLSLMTVASVPDVQLQAEQLSPTACYPRLFSPCHL